VSPGLDTCRWSENLMVACAGGHVDSRRKRWNSVRACECIKACPMVHDQIA
jgi:hypothetical protein